MAGASNRSDYMSSTVHDLERADCSGELDEQGWDGGGIRCQHVSLLDLQQDQMVGVSCKPSQRFCKTWADTMHVTCRTASAHRRQNELDRPVRPALERVLNHQLGVRLALQHC